MQFHTIKTGFAAIAAFAFVSPCFAEEVGGKEIESYVAHKADCHFTARTAKSGIDTVKLTVSGVCQEPTPGYKLALTRVDLPGIESSTLALALTVTAPKGIEPQHVTPTPVEYDQTFVVAMHRPTKVTIFEAAATVDVNTH